MKLPLEERSNMTGNPGCLSAMLRKQRTNPCETQQLLYPPDRSGSDLPSDLIFSTIRSESTMKLTPIVYTSNTGHTRQYDILLGENIGVAPLSA